MLARHIRVKPGLTYSVQRDAYIDCVGSTCHTVARNFPDGITPVLFYKRSLMLGYGNGRRVHYDTSGTTFAVAGSKTAIHLCN